MRAIVSIALLLLAVIFLTVILGYRHEGMCGCPMCRGGCARRIGGKCPFYAGYTSYEAFGTSPGTMTQLATSHVPSESDVPILKQWLADRKEGVYMMTEEDLKHGAPMTPLRIGAYN
jgi:hypothetical protein